MSLLDTTYSPYCNSGFVQMLHKLNRNWPPVSPFSQPGTVSFACSSVAIHLLPQNYFCFGKRCQIRTVRFSQPNCSNKFVMFSAVCVVMCCHEADALPSEYASLCTSVLPPLNKWHHLHTFPSSRHLDKLVMDLGRANLFHVQKWNRWMHLKLNGVSDWHGSL
jgi:hypothetical protein